MGVFKLFIFEFWANGVKEIADEGIEGCFERVGVTMNLFFDELGREFE